VNGPEGRTFSILMLFAQILPQPPDPSMCISDAQGGVMYLAWDFRLVVLSVAVAIIGSFVALECAHRMAIAEQRRNRRLFLFVGAGLMGLAIWTMHFIGMLALQMPMPVSYSPAWTAVSIFAAAVGAALAFYIMSRRRRGWFHIAAGGTAMGLAIVSMHYLGMESMRMGAMIDYDPGRFAASVAIAVAASAGALAIGFWIPRARSAAYPLKGSSSVVMGFAIAGMHYMGMAAARYRSASVADARAAEPMVGHIALGDVVIGASVLFGGALIALASRAAFERERALAAHRQLASELEQRVHERTRELELANQDLSDFSYTVSHDLRSPLRNIAGFADALRDSCETKLDPTELHYLARIRAAVERMDAQLSGLLHLAHVSRAPVERVDVDLSALAHSILADLAAQEPQRTVEIVVAAGLHASADRALLTSALQNLLANAWKFTGKKASPRIEFSARAQDGETVFVVRDNGAGFDLAKAQRIFGMFERMHRATEFSGQGIGLAVTSRIIARHGGRIWVEAAPEKGAAFFFTLGTTEPAPPMSP
jgi:NO-binding membrane sensor protein with MHYT domain/anti-sigma regulatory factor (Ser/Thr protein kinase)